ncbi:phosphotransferase [Candidatus Uabimicrobium sp. HlEnr_7]|uniref:phosphotransferase n=1 Tax=Candidatus Uabimicrobium helgolandensis TaxID=3095367 RepID=UPI003558F4B1
MNNVLLKKIFHQFEVKDSCKEILPYGSGNIHDTYVCKLRDSSLRYLLQKINLHVFPAPDKVMENISLVTSFLQKKWQKISPQNVDRRVLKIIPTITGKNFYQDTSGNSWRMYHFICRSVCYENITKSLQGKKIAGAFALFQKLLLDFPVEKLYPVIPQFHNICKRFSDLENAIEKDSYGRYSDIKELAKQLVQHEDFCKEVANFETYLPLKVVHNDTKVNNILFDVKSKEAICVVDLDLVMPGFSIYDFGDLARSATCHKERGKFIFRSDYFEALLNGYMEEAQHFLNNAEKKYLIDSCKVIACELAFRFLTDYLEGDKYFKISHPFHNLDRVKRQIQFINSLDSQRQLVEAMFRKYK